MASVAELAKSVHPRTNRIANFVDWLLTPLGSAIIGLALFLLPSLLKGTSLFVSHVWSVQVAWLDLPSAYGATIAGTGIAIPFVGILVQRLDLLRIHLDLLRGHDEIVDVKSRNAVLEDRLRLLPLLTDDVEVMHVPVTVSNFNNFLAYVPLYIACELELFHEERLCVDIVHNKDDLTAVRTLVERKASFAITDPTYCFTEAGHRLDNVKIIAPFINRVALWAVSNTPSGQPDETLLKCRTYGKDSTAAILATRWCRSRGASDPVCVEITQSQETLAGYLTRLLDVNVLAPTEREKPNVLIVTEPEATWLSSKGFVPDGTLSHGNFSEMECLQAEFSKTANPTFAFAAIMSRQDFIIQHPHIIERFLRAMRFAYFYIHSLPDLPTRGIGKGPDAQRQATNSFLREPGAKNWRSLLTIVKKHIVHAYPNAFDHIPEEVIAMIIDRFRREGYYPTTVIPDQEFEEGFRRAYRARFDGWPEGTEALMSTVAASFLSI